MSTTYDESQIVTTEGLDSIRKRPGRYIGGNDSGGMIHLVWEVIDNAIDEAEAGYGDRIGVTRLKDGGFEVFDRGRGMPWGRKDGGASVLVSIFTKLSTGGKFNSSSYKASGGLNGVGIKAVTAMSSRVDVTTVRKGKAHSMSFKDGEPGVFTPTGRFSPKDMPRADGDVDYESGTTVRWWTDPDLFQPDAVVDWSAVVERVKEKAYLLPHVTFVVKDEVEGTEEEFHHPGGVGDYVSDLAEGDMLTPVIHFSGSYDYSEKVPVLQEDGSLKVEPVDRTMEVLGAFGWDSSVEGKVRSYVNVVSTPDGGTHVSGLENGLWDVLNAEMKSAKVLKAKDGDLDKKDPLEGLVCALKVSIPEPQFHTQTKEKLTTTEARKAVQEIVSDTLRKWMRQRGNKKAAKELMEKVHQAAKARVAAKSRREIARQKRALKSSISSGKLRDCSEHNGESELFIIEGDSAGGTAMAARDPKLQAILPLKGKPLNVIKASTEKVLKNNEIQSIIKAIGAGVGSDFDVSKSRFERIVIMADADVDGDHIRCLLLGFFWKYMPDLLREGKVVSAIPPLYQVKYYNPVTRKYEEDFAVDEEGLEEINSRLKEIKAKEITTIRQKGLGEANADTLEETTMSMENRSVRRITLNSEEEEEALKAVLDFLDDDSSARKEFVETCGEEMSIEDIDL